MKSTTTLGMASLAIIGAVVVGSAVYAHAGEGGLFKRGEAKREVAAEVLGISTDELKSQVEESSFEEVLAAYGYDSVEAFHVAAEPVIRQNLADKGLSEEEIDEKLAHMAERREIGEDTRAAFESLLGISKDEVKDLRDGGQTMAEILEANGFADRDAFHAAVAESLTTAWTEEGVDADTIAKRLERFENRGERHGGPGGHKNFRGNQ